MAMVRDPADHSAAEHGCPVTATNGPLPMGLRSYRPPAQNLTGAKPV
jgi:hypothetical protein